MKKKDMYKCNMILKTGDKMQKDNCISETDWLDVPE